MVRAIAAPVAVYYRAGGWAGTAVDQKDATAYTWAAAQVRENVAGYESDSEKTSHIILDGKCRGTTALLYLYSQWIFVVSHPILPVSKLPTANAYGLPAKLYRQRVFKRLFNRSNRRTKVKHTLVVFHPNRHPTTVLQVIGN